MNSLKDVIAIVCPDIHGRKFWKDIAEKYDGSIPFIFLGDYLDCYSNEKISFEEAKKNFEEIIEFKEKHGDNVILLIGNHDLSYYDYQFRCCRYSPHFAEWYCDFLNDNFDKFKIAYSFVNNNKTLLFTHAGVHPMWVEDNKINDIKCAEDINELFKNNPNIFTDFSYYRGGFKLYGSPVWADIREFSYLTNKDIDDNIIQIVGHTQLIDGMVNFKNIYCIDSRQPFVITKTNKIKPYKEQKKRK